jgi:acetoin utilization protein AcuC
MAVYHRFAFSDPILFGHISDTINGQIHVLLYILNDPTSPRFEVDCLPNGVPTQFGTQHRNLPAEMAAMEYGLAPGQIRRGLRMLGSAIKSFEAFVASLGHEVYFAEPLHYHNAILFEKYGFAYEKGRRLMNRIQAGFGECGDLHATLDSSTPFRHPEAAHSIRLRSWAIHDGILGEPFNNVTMYKWIGKSAGIDSCPRLAW